MIRNLFLPIILSLAVLPAACAHTGTQTPQAGTFALYLLAGDVPAGRVVGVDPRTLPLREPPLLTGADIVAYSRATHDVELTQAAYRRIQQLYARSVGTDGLPFVVCVGRQPVYAGAF